MQIEQIYTGCLAQGAYYITSNGEAAIIDPLRETQPYIDRLERDNVKLKYVFETHFHADFVSGHLDLAEKSGAKIVFGCKSVIKSLEEKSKGDELTEENIGTLGLKSRVSEDLTKLGPIEGIS